MIEDGIDYGEDFCRAVEPGPDVECSMGSNDAWDTNTDFNTMKTHRSHGPFRTIQDSMRAGNRYRQPIKPKDKMKLQAGEYYRMRNGEIVGPVVKRDYSSVYIFEDYRKSNDYSWLDNGKWQDNDITSGKDIIEHIPKDKSMTFEEWFQSHEDGEWKSTRQSLAQQAYEAGLKAGEVAKKMREDMRISTGDLVFHKHAQSIRKIIGFDFSGPKRLYQLETFKMVEAHELIKITNPAHIQALTEIYEGMK